MDAKVTRFASNNAWNAQAEEAALLFGNAQGGTISRQDAVDAISAMGIAVRDAEVNDIIADEVTTGQLPAIAENLRSRQYTRDELQKLIHDLNPNSSGTVSRGTLIYILKANHHLPDEHIEEFFNNLNVTEVNGMLQVDELVNALLAVMM